MNAHKACIDDSHTGHEGLDGLPTMNQAPQLAIFGASRQIYQEVFPLFWRTSRFCLETNTFIEFSDNLNETQRDNVRNLVVLYSVEHCCYDRKRDWDRLYLHTQDLWTAGQGKDAMELRLCNLARFDVHLQLLGCEGALNITKSHLRTIHIVLRVLEQLGSPTLQNVSVTISDEIDLGGHRSRYRLTQQQISDVNESFRHGLTSGTERGSTLIDTLARDIRKHEALANKFYDSMTAWKEKGDEFDDVATAYREEAEEAIEKSTELMRQLRTQLWIDSVVWSLRH